MLEIKKKSNLKIEPVTIVKWLIEHVFFELVVMNSNNLSGLAWM